jgi:hypothetical protein
LSSRSKRRRRDGATGGAGDFIRDYTRGLNRADFGRLFRSDAAEAYQVLTRDHRGEPEPEGRLRRLLHRIRLLFLGVSYKLTPARRLLFAAGLLSAVLGLAHCSILVDDSRLNVAIDGSPVLTGFGFGCLLFLLALELVDRVRVRDELEVARQLQGDLLPLEAPEAPGWRFAHSYRTANEVGGDYYDFIPLADGRLALVIGDASGHGMAAGLLMAIANATLHTAVDVDPRPEPVAAMLNRALLRTGGQRAFLTLFYAVLDLATGTLDHHGAGHPFPLLRRAAGGAVEELGSGGLPLGLRPGVEPPAARVTVRPGDLLLLYTDGLAEAVDPAGRAFGFERLAALVGAGGDAGQVHARIVAAFEAHLAGGPLHDDVSLVGVERLAAQEPPAGDGA